jgi:hypothetical protein
MVDELPAVAGGLEVSCDRTMSRQVFIRKLLNRAAAAGTLVYAAAIADEFIAPPARASVSGATTITRTDIVTNQIVRTQLLTTTISGTVRVMTDFITQTLTNTIINTVTDTVTNTVTITTTVAPITTITLPPTP